MILAQAFQRFAFDLDGVVWKGDDPIPGAPETIRALRDAGKRVCFVTNNSAEVADTYVRKLDRMGAGATASEIVSSADATAHMLDRDVPGVRGRLAFVIGGEGLRAAVASVGARLASLEEGSDASVVVVGIDRDLTYDKLRAATLAIRKGATFIASNADATYPYPEGLVPGAGAIVAALRTASGVEPAVAGKPDPTMLEIAAERLGGTPALAVGDRLDTDILAAHTAGWPCVLVLSGASGVPDLAVARVWPDFIVRRLSDLLVDRPFAKVRSATGPDLPHIAGILHAGGLISGAARERLGRTVVAEVDRKVIGTGAWELAGESAILRSVGVDEACRGAGVGTLVVGAVLRRIAEAGHRDVYLATDGAEEFFVLCGFRPFAREDAPPAVIEHRQIARECPSTATLMRLRLPFA
ncbi:MAG: HAD-IIA family hydrolase [Actinomycetota bacterium]